MKYLKSYALFENVQKFDIERLKELFLNEKFNDEFHSLIDAYVKSIDLWKRSSPPKIAEKEYNLKGISTTWKIPYDLTAETVENLSEIFEQNVEIINIIFNEFLKLNPELKFLKNYPFKGKKFSLPIGGIIGGCCSSMNIDDIKDYLDNSTQIKKYNKNKSPRVIIKRLDDNSQLYTDLYDKLYQKGVHLQWFPSIKTLENIIKQVGNKTWKKQY